MNTTTRRTAEPAGVTRSELQGPLAAHGVEPRLGPTDLADAAYAIETMGESK